MVRGISDAAAREVRVRAQAALAAIGRAEELRGIVTLDGAPGAAGDVAVALAGIGEDTGSTAIVGELSLDGRIRPVRGIYSHVLAARDRGAPIIVPGAQAREAGLVEGATVYAAHSLGDVLAHFEGSERLAEVPHTDVAPAEPKELFDTDRMRERYGAARSRLVDALGAGHRRILLVAPAGCGSVLLAREARSLLGALTAEEALDVTAVHSAAGLVDATVGYVATRPFRAPHLTVSVGGLLGGQRPGEASLAHHGVLLLDDVVEFRGSTLSALWASLGRGSAGADFPAVPRLVVASARPCDCGHARSTARDCSCTERARASYDRRLAEVAASFDVTIEWS